MCEDIGEDAYFVAYFVSGFGFIFCFAFLSLFGSVEQNMTFSRK